jgi:hypothetical protein
MDDEKEQEEDGEKKSLTERITKTVKGIVDTTSEAAMKALTPSGSDPAHKEAHEPVYVPRETIPMAQPAPPVDPIDDDPLPQERVAPKRANKRAARSKKSVRNLKEGRAAAKKAARRLSKKLSKTKSTKALPKKSKGKTMAKKAKKKAAAPKKSAVKKSAVKKTKTKSRR